MNDGFAEFGSLDIGLRGVVLGDLQFTEERFTSRYDQNQMVDADSAPCAAIGLPVPVVHDYCFARIILLPFAGIW